MVIFSIVVSAVAVAWTIDRKGGFCDGSLLTGPGRILCMVHFLKANPHVVMPSTTPVLRFGGPAIRMLRF